MVNRPVNGPVLAKEGVLIFSKDFTSGVGGGQHRVRNGIKISFLYTYIHILMNLFYNLTLKSLSLQFSTYSKYPKGSYWSKICTFYQLATVRFSI